MKRILAVVLASAVVASVAPAPMAAPWASSSAQDPLAHQPNEEPQSLRGYELPLPGTIASLVIRGFQAPANRYAAGHRGVDLAAEAATAVSAPAGGTVTFNGRVAGRPLIVIEHEDGLRSTLEPVESDLSSGTVVVRGQSVGEVATGHDCRGAATCLHWGVRNPRGDYLNPLMLLGVIAIRLYPS
ncbi:M23 family metallopeptidase [Rarobacter faecitabidus]|uniref:Peptidase M23-like protein n=1 Tax=Rarobacter faecitabidus TaxID=13243 RepID=A0A542ZWE9_RARFA|nr:peptidoglycan DD-metalloendopeptidase family protein [Rarobacter faecitabidus]TQL64693.1 peptidase M23-like protein [Rarobacter faecitabidus]